MTHLESNPNLPKPSCDESNVGDEDLPIVNSKLYVSSGDVVKVHCNAKDNQRLVLNTTHHVEGGNCYGDFLDLVCFKISDHVAEWRVLSDPSNSKLPKCVDECINNRFVMMYSGWR